MHACVAVRLLASPDTTRFPVCGCVVVVGVCGCVVWLVCVVGVLQPRQGLLEGVRFELPLGARAQDWMLEDLQAVWDASTSMAIILNDVLDLGQLQRGQMTLQPAPVDLRNTIHRAVHTLNGLASVPVVIKIGASVPPLVVVDELRVGQIVTNAVSNAAKATKRGQIEVVVVARDGRICIEVVDTGRGLPPGTGDLFQPYAQVAVDGTASSTWVSFSCAAQFSLQ